MPISFNRLNPSLSPASVVVPATAAPAEAGAPAPTSAPADDQSALNQLGTLIVGFYRYLERHLTTHPELAIAVTSLRLAVSAYRARQVTEVQQAIQATLAGVQTARAQDPSIPQP